MEVVDEIKNDSNVTSQTAKQIGLQLNQDWNDLSLQSYHMLFFEYNNIKILLLRE